MLCNGLQGWSGCESPHLSDLICYSSALPHSIPATVAAYCPSIMCAHSTSAPLPGPSVRNASSFRTHSLTSFRSLLINCLLRECFSDHPVLHQSLLTPSPIYFSLNSYHLLKYKLFVLLWFFLLHENIISSLFPTLIFPQYSEKFIYIVCVK